MVVAGCCGYVALSSSATAKYSVYLKPCCSIPWGNRTNIFFLFGGTVSCTVSTLSHVEALNEFHSYLYYVMTVFYSKTNGWQWDSNIAAILAWFRLRCYYHSWIWRYLSVMKWNWSHTHLPCFPFSERAHTHTNTRPDALFSVCYLPRRLARRCTQQPLIPPHNTPSQANTWDHNAVAAIHAGSRMPLHKITMTREGQKTELFTVGVHAGQQYTFTPHRSKWIFLHHSEDNARVKGPGLRTGITHTQPSTDCKRSHLLLFNRADEQISYISQRDPH